MSKQKVQQEMAGLNSKAEKKRSKGQQEMVGFVLIVVLVVVAMMVFLIISLRTDNKGEKNSLETKNMLDAVMGYTTTCALVFEPQYETIEDLFKSGYEMRNCNNNGKTAKTYLNESLISILDTLMETEATIKGYQLSLIQKDETGENGQMQIISGDCENITSIESAQRNLVSGSDRLIVRLKICRG